MEQEIRQGLVRKARIVGNGGFEPMRKGSQRPLLPQKQQHPGKGQQQPRESRGEKRRDPLPAFAQGRPAEQQQKSGKRQRRRFDGRSHAATQAEEKRPGAALSPHGAEQEHVRSEQQGSHGEVALPQVVEAVGAVENQQQQPRAHAREPVAAPGKQRHREGCARNR